MSYFQVGLSGWNFKQNNKKKGDAVSKVRAGFYLANHKKIRSTKVFHCFVADRCSKYALVFRKLCYLFGGEKSVYVEKLVLRAEKAEHYLVFKLFKDKS